MERKKEVTIILSFLLLFIIIIYQFINSSKNIDNINLCQKGPKLNISRKYPSSILLNNNNLLVIGGNSDKAAETAELYDYNTKKFFKLENPSYNHYKSFLIKRGDGKIIILDNNPIEIYEPDKKEFMNTNICLFSNDCNQNRINSYNLSRAVQLDASNALIIYKNSLFLFNLYNFNIKKIVTLSSLYDVIPLANNKILIVTNDVKINNEGKSHFITYDLNSAKKIKEYTHQNNFGNRFDLVKINPNEIFIIDGVNSYLFNTVKNQLIKLKPFDKYKILYDSDAISYKKDEVIIFPGNINDNTPNLKLYIYNSKLNHWFLGPNMQFSSKGSAKIILNGEELFLIGGIKNNTNNVPINSTQMCKLVTK